MSYWSDQKYGTGANGLRVAGRSKLRAAGIVGDKARTERSRSAIAGQRHDRGHGFSDSLLGEVSEAARQSRIVVVKVRERLVGLLVDGASQVLKVPVASIEAAPEEVVEIDANYLRGVAKLESRLIILMDLNKVLALELREGGANAD